MRKSRFVVAAFAALLLATSALAGDLIPRSLLFGNPEKAQARISPDGTKVSWLAPVNGVLNVFVAPANDLSAAKVITQDTKRGIRTYFWAFNNDYILYTQDAGGNENFNIYAADVKTGETRNLTNNPAVRAEIESVNPKTPDEIIVGLNGRDPRFHDLHTVNIRTGSNSILMNNPGNLGGGIVAGMGTDNDNKVNVVVVFNNDGTQTVYSPKTDKAAGDVNDYTVLGQIPAEDTLTTNVLGVDKTGDLFYLADSRGRDTAAFVEFNRKTGEKKVLAEDAKADVGGAFMHPTEHRPQAVSFNYDRQKWVVLDPTVQADFDFLKGFADGDFNVTSRTLDDSKWTVVYVMDNGPVRQYLYDRAAKKATLLFTTQPKLEGVALAKMYPVVIKSRDGLDLVSYLTLPKGVETKVGSDGIPRPTTPVPLVLNVHGGPWARDGWGLNPTHQWLADRGYAVLSVNYRGSTGFGKKFLNAANKEWAGKMHDDLLDAVNWTTKEGIANKDKVAIMGGSYGGYATLVGLTFTPDTFACGVDIVGPSRIVTLLNTIPAYWASGAQIWRTRVGDHKTEEGIKFLDSRSPLTYVDKIKKPLLIGQGANDPRVKQTEADQIVKAMREKNIPVTYVLYPDEGHGFARPENRMSFNAITEQFLAQYLGGKSEPIGGDFANSSLKVPEGVDNVTGVKEAIGSVR